MKKHRPALQSGTGLEANSYAFRFRYGQRERVDELRHRVNVAMRSSLSKSELMRQALDLGLDQIEAKLPTATN